MVAALLSLPADDLIIGAFPQTVRQSGSQFEQLPIGTLISLAFPFPCLPFGVVFPVSRPEKRKRITDAVGGHTHWDE